jgi:DNA-binding response OmpR family regulator
MPKKILLVEDNTELLELLSMNCEDAGFATATATNGVEALEKARAFSPDLIVLDLVLPELDGFAVCETLRKEPATASVPIIMLSGLSSQFSRYAGFESGGTDFFTKPTSPSTLIARIKHLLRDTPEASISAR